MVKQHIPTEFQAWIDARKKHKLSHKHVQMARELGLNPKKLGKLDNHQQEPWKEPLPQFLETLYFKRFKREAPQELLTIEQLIAKRQEKKQLKKAAKAALLNEKGT